MLKRLFRIATELRAVFKLIRPRTIATVAIFFGSVLTVAIASAGPNLVLNGNFSQYSPYYDFNGWKVSSIAKVAPVRPYFPLATEAGGVLSAIQIYCERTCPDNSTQTISQQINNLVPGNKYELSYYAAGWGQINEDFGILATMSVDFGNQKFDKVTLPGPSATSHFAVFAKQTNNFTYTGTATSAVLKFIQYLQLYGGTYCVPCAFLDITNVQLQDLGPAAPPPTLSVQNALGTGGRINDADQFKVSILNAATSAVLGSGTTGGTGSTVSGGLANITGDTATNYKLVEEMQPGSASSLAQYSATLSCTNANSAGTPFSPGSVSLGQNFPLLVAGDQVSCTVTNTPKAPTVRLTKALGAGGRIANADQFTVLVQQRLSDVASGTTLGTGSSISGGTTGWTTLAAGTSYNLNEVMAAGSASRLGQYTGVVSCSNALAGSSTVVPTVPGAAFTPAYGDVLDCTVTNTAKPSTLTLTQLVISPFPVNLAPPFTFNYSINNGWPVQPQPLTTTKFNVPVSTVARTLAASNTATTLSTSLPDTRWFVSSFACTDSNAAITGNPTGNLVRVLNPSVTIPAGNVRAGSALKCTLIVGHYTP